MMLRFILPFALMSAAMSSTDAAPPEIRLGQYIRDQDSGTLTIRRNEQKRLIFEIESIGGNCHICGVSGVVRGSIGHGDSWAANGEDSKCDISFSADRSTLEIKPINQEECRAYCGARAGFDGTYRIPPSACTSAGREAQRDEFLSLYRSRRFAQAVKKLQALTAQCGQFISWIEMDRIRNDIALAQYHNGDASQCLQTLDATIAASVKDEEELKAGKGSTYLPPCDFDNYIDVAKSTWFNKALCTKALSKGR
jgi:hypothetical protein